MDNPENQLWLSPVSIWEALLLHRKKRINISDDFAAWITTALNRMALIEAPLTFEVAQSVAEVTLPHADPADLFLAASARAFELTLVTADRNLIQSKGLTVLANL